VSLLTSGRHFGPLKDVPTHDIPWHDKKNMAVFRGANTGNAPSHARLEGWSLEERCQVMLRCRLVLQTHASPLVNAHLAGLLSRKLLLRSTLGNISLYAPKLTLAEMLQYKALIVLEGHDVATGFKWAQYSNSVVMAPPFTKSSWAMEDLLIPWVHYIPISETFEDVHEKMQWVIDHDKEAQAIARAGQLWMMDLWTHPQADADTKAIYNEILKRYARHWVYDPDRDWSSL